jgi:exopolyphosphatase/guanosine-5'-triphosphate,3'-diphosphate pyrophosphatase
VRATYEKALSPLSPTHLDMSPRRFAALDIGSLTVRLAVAERTGPGRFRVVQHHREVTGLGQGLARTGSLAPAGMARTLAALRKFLQAAAALGVQDWRAVATQAVRQAENREIFLNRLRQELGLTVEVLAAEEEARLSLQGVLTVLAPQYLQAPILVCDVGGGSSEFALVRPGQEPQFASLPLGVLTLSQARPLGDPPEPEKVAALHAEIAEKLSQFRHRAFPTELLNAPRLVGTAGAVTTLAAMALKMTAYDPERVNNLVLTRERVAELAGRLAGMTEAQRARLPGLEPAKAGVMVAGALIILALLEVFRQDSLVVVDAGLLEGVLASFEC